MQPVIQVAEELHLYRRHRDPPLPPHTKPVTPEEQRAFLTGYDFFVLIDKSGTMKYKIEEGCDETRIEIVKEHLKTIVNEAVKYDPDAIEFLEHIDNLIKGATCDIVDTGDIEELSGSEGARQALVDAIWGKRARERMRPLLFF